MVARKQSQVIQGRRLFIVMDIIEPGEAYGGGSVYDYGSALDEEEKSSLGETGVSTGLTETGTKEVEEVQKDVKAISIPSYMLKSTSLLAYGFKDNNKE